MTTTMMIHQTITADISDIIFVHNEKRKCLLTITVQLSNSV